MEGGAAAFNLTQPPAPRPAPPQATESSLPRRGGPRGAEGAGAAVGLRGAQLGVRGGSWGTPESGEEGHGRRRPLRGRAARPPEGNVAYPVINCPAGGVTWRRFARICGSTASGGREASRAPADPSGWQTESARSPKKSRIESIFQKEKPTCPYLFI